MDIGKLGLWFFLETLPSVDAAAFVQRLEGLGYPALWIPEAVGREPFAHSGYCSRAPRRSRSRPASRTSGRATR